MSTGEKRNDNASAAPRTVAKNELFKYPAPPVLVLRPSGTDSANASGTCETSASVTPPSTQDSTASTVQFSEPHTCDVTQEEYETVPIESLLLESRRLGLENNPFYSSITRTRQPDGKVEETVKFNWRRIQCAGCKTWFANIKAYEVHRDDGGCSVHGVCESDTGVPLGSSISSARPPSIADAVGPQGVCSRARSRPESSQPTRSQRTHFTAGSTREYFLAGSDSGAESSVLHESSADGPAQPASIVDVQDDDYDYHSDHSMDGHIIRPPRRRCQPTKPALASTSSPNSRVRQEDNRPGSRYGTFFRNKYGQSR